MPAERFWGIALLLAYRDTSIEEHLRKCRRLAFEFGTHVRKTSFGLKFENATPTQLCLCINDII